MKVFPLSSTFTTVQREHGRRLSSARRALYSQQRALVVRPFSLVVMARELMALLAVNQVS